jgi:DNA-binding transcriptional ArsR family regulator
MKENEELIVLSEEIKGTQKILTALGDEMRQHLILVMTQSGNCSGMRVNDIAEKTSLSRPAVSHKLKTLADVSDYQNGDPEWYKSGLEAALLAPTAMNQQKFKFERNGDKVKTKAGLGFYSKTDLGIVKYHFELGAGKDIFNWG